MTLTSDNEIDAELAWALLLLLPDSQAQALTRSGEATEPGAKNAVLVRRGAQWVVCGPVSGAASVLFDLYLPLCSFRAHRTLLVGHLGQSLDGRIATQNGHSHYVNGPENITHLHRMRALFDAVIVGAETVRRDDPQLTTRRVDGPSPVRVILDASGRLSPDFGVFSDAAAPTLQVRSADQTAPTRIGNAAVVCAPCKEGQFDLPALIAILGRRGLSRLFVEGGGLTVSRFLQRKLLDRLQLTVAPLIIGSGRPAISLPPIDDLADGLRPQHRRIALGVDLLYELDFSSSEGAVGDPPVGCN